MGRYCRICGNTRSNESFSGRGHPQHVCKTCARMPKDEREAIESEDEIVGFMNQSHISDKNILRLQVLSESKDSRIAQLASLVLQVARIKPFKKRRLKVLAQQNIDLLDALEKNRIDLCARFLSDERTSPHGLGFVRRRAQRCRSLPW